MKKFAKVFVSGTVSFFPLLSFAQYRVPIELRNLVQTLTNYAVGIIIVLSVLFIIYGAFVFLTSQGNSTKTGEARSIIIYSVVAIVVALLASVLVRIVMEVFAPFGGGLLPV